MAAFVYIDYCVRRARRRERVFRDKTNPLDMFDDTKILGKFRFTREAIYGITESIYDQIVYVQARRGGLSPLQQVLLTLRFYATGCVQDVIGELMGASQSTVSRTISRVTEAMLTQLPKWIRLPTQVEARQTKQKFHAMRRFGNVVGCIDGTHVRIQAPSDLEHEYVNRKNFHSINVQVICDADLLFINVIAKWPGSVHDARILRECSLFQAFESGHAPINGILLGDSGYMLRPWLMTPVSNPQSAKERHYNFAHSSTRCTVERSIGVAKQRFQCLRVGLRVEPPKACKIIMACLMLHNCARRQRIPEPPSDSDSDCSSADEDAGDYEDDTPCHQNLTERARLAGGKRARNIIMDSF